MNCAKCKSAMRELTVGEHVVNRCEACGGLWFDLREHEHIAEDKAAVAKLDVGDRTRGQHNNAMRDAQCPVCDVKLLKLAVATQPHMQYESCPVCHGAYFDAGEFTDYAKLSLPEQVKLFFRGFRQRRA